MSARRSTPGYRLRMWMRRNSLAAALSAATLTALAGAGLVSSLALVGQLRAKAEAERQGETANQALEFVVDLFEAASPEDARGESLTALEVLGRGVDRVREEELTPVVRARILHTLADVHVRLGRYDEARDLAEEALATRESVFSPDSVNRRVISIREKVLGKSHPDTASSYANLGVVMSRLAN